MTCTNCTGCLQETTERWLCAWCGASGRYMQGPVLSNGKRWRVRVTDVAGRVGERRAWVAAESVSYPERARVMEAKHG